MTSPRLRLLQIPDKRLLPELNRSDLSSSTLYSLDKEKGALTAPTMSNYEQIAKQAEQDLNTYQAKTGNARRQDADNAGVNPLVENQFEGAQVEFGDELSTNRGYNKRIPPSEGGILDDRGR